MRAISVLSLAVLTAVLSGCDKAEAPPALPIKPAVSVTVNTISDEQAKAFADAAFSGDTRTVLTLLQEGMPVNFKTANGCTALMLAAFNGHASTAQALLDARADVSLRDPSGRTALMFASSGPFPETVKRLLDAGADVNAVDHGEHWSPLIFAAGEGQARVADLLLQYGADPKIVDAKGKSAADFAKSRNHPELAEKLQALIDEK